MSGMLRIRVFITLLCSVGGLRRFLGLDCLLPLEAVVLFGDRSTISGRLPTNNLEHTPTKILVIDRD